MEPNKAKTYEPVPTMEDREELLSSTEVDDSLMGDEEKQQWRTSPQESRRKRDTLRSNRWLISAVLQCVIVALLVLILVRQDYSRKKPSETPQVGSVVNGNGPALDTTIRKWDADARFVPTNASEFFGYAVLEQWKTLFPGWGTDVETFSTTTMTHQLHCLFMMARIYAGFRQGTPEILPKDHESHYLHCVDYLRQGIMCSGDLATEPHKPNDSDDNGPLDGSWGGLHVCKDYRQVTTFLGKEIKDGARVVLPIDD
ncbi:Uu.00g042320.m01.CDS01 [Anthostomella pinea]|uniref:Uu.00g042320.m01.CDS01 n=1 Tax=Anthostomella pinea TaxID=933095 RepID=A0AAI8VAI7_9PEZI|nr:Uu.00g042320.m01.CDS01 [Anthostomella pinea]